MIESYVNSIKDNFNIVDTAGIRKKNKVNEDIEYYSVLRAIRAIENSDVVKTLVASIEKMQTVTTEGY